MNKEYELTEWNDGDEKPIREGVYERAMPYGNEYALFIYGKWRISSTTVDKAAGIFEISFNQNQPWRGLLKNPTPDEL